MKQAVYTTLPVFVVFACASQQFLQDTHIAMLHRNPCRVCIVLLHSFVLCFPTRHGQLVSEC